MNLETTCPSGCERCAGAVAFHNIVVESPVFRNDLYIKGYKVDREKLLNNFTPRAWDPENLRMLDIWEKFPTEFLYIAMGNEPDGRISLVIVLAEGYDKEKLEKVSMVDLSREPFSKVFTPGIWVKHC